MPLIVTVILRTGPFHCPGPLRSQVFLVALNNVTLNCSHLVADAAVGLGFCRTCEQRTC